MKKYMKKYLFLSAVMFAAVLGLLTFSAPVHAMIPTLSVSYTGSGDTVQVNVAGDPDASVLLSAGSQLAVLGNTNSSGNFSTTISSATYNILSNAMVYVKTGGINGSQSNSVSWPYIQNSSTTATFTLSQTALLLNAGQTSTITASANYLYVMSNSSPAVANINLNSNQITVTANTYGSTVANICVVGSTTNCAKITITVQSSGLQQLTFSQNNFSIYSGQNISVAVSGGSGSYAISNNSNPTSVQASLNGQTVTITSNNSTGTASITVCTTDMQNCGIINVNSTTANSTAVTFSQTNPVVPIGQSVAVTIYGGTGNNFYVSSNSNPSIVQANINSNVLTLIGNSSTGTSSISVCAYQGSCGSLTANVASAGSSNGPISLSQASLSILAGQSSNITVLGGSTPYSVSAPASANIINTSVSGNILTVYGVNPGSTTVNVCASIGCTILSVTINSVNSTNSGNPILFSQNNILLNVGQQVTVYVTSTGNNYYVSSSSYPNVASANINQNAIIISGSSAGSDSILICQSTGQCANVYVTVSAPVSQPVVTPVVTPTPPISNFFTRYLFFGVDGDDVLQLQKILVKKGFLTAKPNGHFGNATKSAVKKFQKAHNLSQLGAVGPGTRTVLNEIYSKGE